MPYSSIVVDKTTADFFSKVTGMPWPEIREGDLREVRDAYQKLAKDLPELRRLIAEVAIKARQQFEGQAAQAFSEQMRQFIGDTGASDYIASATKTAEALAKCANDVATAAEYTKWMAIAQLVQLLLEIALAILWAPFTFGASLAGITLKTIFTREVLKTLMKFLFKTILLHTFAGIMSGLTMDLVIQNIQIGQGNRKEIDKDALKQAVLFGVIGGVISGPLNLIGMGLGKLLGRLLGKSGGRVAADKLSDFMINGDRKALNEALKAGLEGVAKGSKGTLGDVAGVTLKSTATEGTGTWLNKAGSRAFARDLGSILESNENLLRHGFGKAGAGSAADKFVESLAGSFKKHLKGELGDVAAEKLGREFGEAFVKGWGKSGVDHAALSAGLREVLENSGKKLGERGVGALADRMVDVGEHMSQGNRMFHLGYAIGEQLKEGVQGNLTEGFYNLLFTDKHEFTTTLATFGSGMAMGLMARGLHHAATPLMGRYMDWVRDTQFKAIAEGQSKYFPPHHPLTILALLSNLSGNPAPFPVPRLGPQLGSDGGSGGHERLLGFSRGEGGPADGDIASAFHRAFGNADLEHVFRDEADDIRDLFREAFGRGDIEDVFKTPDDPDAVEYAKVFKETLEHVRLEDAFDEWMPGATAPAPVGTVSHGGENVRTQTPGQGQQQGQTQTQGQGHQQGQTQTQGQGQTQRQQPNPTTGETTRPSPVRTTSTSSESSTSPTSTTSTSTSSTSTAPPRTATASAAPDPATATVPTSSAAPAPVPHPKPAGGPPSDPPAPGLDPAPARPAPPTASSTDLPVPPSTTQREPAPSGLENQGSPGNPNGPGSPGSPGHQDTPQPVPPHQQTATVHPGPVPLPVPPSAPAHPTHLPNAAGGSDLRPDYTTRTVNPPAGPRAANEAPSPLRPHEARRGTLPTGERATELVLRLHLDGTGLGQQSVQRVAALQRRALDGVADAYNGGHRLPDGSVLRVRVEFVDAPGTAHHTVRLHDGTVRQDTANWGLRAGRDTLGHEIGRVLGLNDRSREVYREGGVDRPVQGPVPQRLRTVGSAVDEAFAPDHGPDGPTAAPVPPLVAPTVRTTSLYGTGGPEGAGGHLLRDTVRRAHTDGQFQENRNRTVHLEPSADSGEQGRTFFPPHWTADEVVYAAEQAFRDARTRDPDPDARGWEGEYAGVRIVGEQQDGLITGFRPAADQGTQAPPPYAPRRPAPPGPEDFGRPEEFGDRRSMTGVHHAFDPPTGAAHGLRLDPARTVNPNGTARRRVWFLDPSLRPDSPLADLPSRWHRRADAAEDPMHYPANWPAASVRLAAEEALLVNPGRRVPLGDGRTEHVVGEAWNIRFEGLVRDGQLLVHRPLDRQVAWRGGSYGDGYPDTVVARGTESSVNTVGGGLPVTVRRALFGTREAGLEVSVRLHLQSEGMTPADVTAYRQRLQEAADRLVRDQAPSTPVHLRLEFTDDPAGAFSSARPTAGGQPVLRDHLGPLLDAGGDSALDLVADTFARNLPDTPLDVPLPDPVPGSLREPGVADPAGPPRTADLMAEHLPFMRRGFTDAAWDRPGQGVPPTWTADDARYAAHAVATGAVPGVLVPRRSTEVAGQVIEGTVAGAVVRVSMSADGRIAGFSVSRPGPGAELPASGSGPRRILSTAEVEPPRDAFGLRMSGRQWQSYQADRVRLADGDTETVLRLRVHLDTAGLTLPKDELEAGLQGLRQRAVNGVGEHFNRGQRLPNGDLLRVEVTFVDRPEDAHLDARVHQGTNRESLHNWNLGSDERTLAHELGHALGLPDEYREAAWNSRPVYQDGALMTAHNTDRYGHFLTDMDRLDRSTADFHPAQGLPPRYLRDLGAVVDGALGAPRRPATPGGPPPRAAFGEEARRTALEGGPGGRGGHLYPGPAEPGPRPERVPGSEHRNGTFRVLAADPGPAPRHLDTAGNMWTGDAGREPVTRTMFPAHWSADHVVYAAEQAYHSARRTDRVVESDGTYHWTGEYGGVRIEGEVTLGVFGAFRPSDDQDGIATPTFEPPNLGERRFGLHGENHVLFGDRQALTGVHSRPPAAVATVHGVQVDATALHTNDNGTYRAQVWYLDPVVGPDAPLATFTTRWFRRADNAPHTMYPDSWTPSTIRRAVDEAYRNRLDPQPAGDGTEHWVGTHDGVRIEGLTRNGVHLVHRPTADQPISRWHDEEVVERSATGGPVGYGPGDSELTVRHVRFAAGQQGVELHVPVRLRFPADATPQQTAAYRAAVQEAADRLTADVRDSDGRLVRVVAEFVDHDGPGHRTADVTADLPADGVALGRLMPDIDGRLTDLRDLADHARDRAPADGWTPHGDPRPAAVPLREPDSPGTARRPETVSWRASESPGADSGYHLPADWAPVSSGLPVHWTRADALDHLGRAEADGVFTLRRQPVDGGPAGHTFDVLEHQDVTLRLVRDERNRIVGVEVVGDGTFPPQLTRAVPEPGGRSDAGSGTGSNASRRPGPEEPNAPLAPRQDAADDGTQQHLDDSDDDMDDSDYVYESDSDDTDSLHSSDDMDEEPLSPRDEASDRDTDMDSDRDSDLDSEMGSDDGAANVPPHQPQAPRFLAETLPVTVGPPRDPRLLGPSGGAELRGFDARRGRLTTGEAATELVLRIHLDTGQLPDGRATAEAVAALRQRARRSLDNRLNIGHRLPSGDVLLVRTEFVDTPGEAHHHVTVYPGAFREDSARWGLDTDEPSLAHEMTHLFGMADEYRERRIPGTDDNGVAHPERRARPAYPDGGIMGPGFLAEGRIRYDQDAGMAGTDGTIQNQTLAPRNLRELGAAIDGAFGTHVVPPHDAGTPPPRAAFDLDARQLSLYGDRRTSGGHLIPPTGAERRRPWALIERHENGVLHVEFEPAQAGATGPNGRRRAVTVAGPAVAGDLLSSDTAVRRRMFPRHWTADDAVYAAEQAYLDARRTGRVVAVPGGLHRWTGEYAGVRIEGEFRAGRFRSFRPSDVQPGAADIRTVADLRESLAQPRPNPVTTDLGAQLPPPGSGTPAPPPRNAPRRPVPVFGQLAEDVARYGDRQHLTGLHHEVTPVATVNPALPTAVSSDPNPVLRGHGAMVTDRSDPIHNGTYRAQAYFLDPTVAPSSPLAEIPTRWRTDAATRGRRTMYPRGWTATELLANVDHAYSNALHAVPQADGRTVYWVGEAGGVRIEGLSRDGAHLAHRPTDAQPMTVWDGNRVRAVTEFSEVLVGGRPLPARRVLFDSDQVGLDITVRVLPDIDPAMTAEQRDAAGLRIHRDVAAFVQDRAMQGVPEGEVPPVLLNVRVEFVTDPAVAFTAVRVRQGAQPGLVEVLGPLVVHGGQDSFAGVVHGLLTHLAPTHQELFAAAGPAARPADLREPGPLRPGETPPADLLPMADLGLLEAAFSPGAWAADPRDLPADRSLPREWTAHDTHWIADWAVTQHDDAAGQGTDDGVVEWSYQGVRIRVELHDGLIVGVEGVGDQRDVPQLHVPPQTHAAGPANVPVLLTPGADGPVLEAPDPVGLLRTVADAHPDGLRQYFGLPEDAPPAEVHRLMMAEVAEYLQRTGPEDLPREVVAGFRPDLEPNSATADALRGLRHGLLNWDPALDGDGGLGGALAPLLAHTFEVRMVVVDEAGAVAAGFGPHNTATQVLLRDDTPVAAPVRETGAPPLTDLVAPTPPSHLDGPIRQSTVIGEHVRADGVREQTLGHLDAAVEPGSPLSRFPSRWWSPEDPRGPLAYPAHWSADGIAEAARTVAARPDRRLDLEDGRHRWSGVHDGVEITGISRGEEILAHGPADHRPDSTAPDWTDSRQLHMSEEAEIDLGGVRFGARWGLLDSGHEVHLLVLPVHLDTSGMTPGQAESVRARLTDHVERLFEDSTAHRQLRATLDFTDSPQEASWHIGVGRITLPAALQREHEQGLIDAVFHGTEHVREGMDGESAPMLRFPDPDDPPAAPELRPVPPRFDRRLFEPQALVHSGLGLPREWIADERHHAAEQVLRASDYHRDRLRTQAIVEGEFAGVRMRLLVDNGRILDYHAPSGQRFGDQASASPVPPPAPGRVLRTVEVRPPDTGTPEGRFLSSLQAQRIQAFEARRVMDPDGDTRTVLTVRVHLDTDGLTSTGARRTWDIEHVHLSAETGLRQVYDRGQRLPDGSRLEVAVRFVGPTEAPHHTVGLWDGTVPEDSGTWGVESHPRVIAHEIGHLLGLDDEYRRPGSDPRPVYPGLGLMSSASLDRYGRPSFDAAHPRQDIGTDMPEAAVRPHHLDQLGAVLDRAFGRPPAVTPPGTQQRRAEFGEDARRTSLEDGQDGRGGHLPAPPASGRRRLPPVPGSENPNGTYRTDVGGPADGRRSGDRYRMMFPDHWDADDAVYNAKQAYLDARRTNGVTGPVDGRQRWTGEYGGVRIEGEILGGEFIWFRPSDNQHGLEATTFVPQVRVTPFGHRVDELNRYGDRHTLTGFHNDRPRPDHLADRGLYVGPDLITNSNDTRRAHAYFLDPTVAPGSPMSRFPSRWHRRADEQGHTFYPKDWGPEDTLERVDYAYRNRTSSTRLPDGSVHWTGRSRGVRIEGIVRDGQHLVHRPTDDQQAAGPAGDPPASTLRAPVTPGTGERPPTRTREEDENPAELSPDFHKDLAKDAGRGLPPEWAEAERRYAARMVANQSDGPNSPFEGEFAGVRIRGTLRHGQITDYEGVPGQEFAPQRRRPPAAQQPPLQALHPSGSQPHEQHQQPHTPQVEGEAPEAGSPLLRALVEEDPQLLRKLFGEEEGGRLAADPAAAERALHELVQQRFRDNPELAREAHELHTAWARRLGIEPADWQPFVEDLRREITARPGTEGGGAVEPRIVRDAFAVLTAAALDLRVTLVDVRDGRAPLAEFGTANGRRTTIDHTEQDGYSAVAAAERRQEQERLDRQRREREQNQEEVGRASEDEQEQVRRASEDEQDQDRERLRQDSDEEPTEQELQQIRRNAEGKAKAPRTVDGGEDNGRNPVDENLVPGKRETEELDLPEINRRFREMEDAEAARNASTEGQSSTSRPSKSEVEEAPAHLPKDEIQEAPAHPPKDEIAVAPVPPKPAERAPLLPPRAVTESGMLSGSHMVTAIGEPSSVLTVDLAARIADALPPATVNREALARTLAESLFSDSGLRAQVSSLSRGEVLHIPVGTDARQGTITVRGEVAELVHRSKDKAKAKFEYEGGSDRVVTLGTTTGGRKRGGLGLQGRFDFVKLFRVQAAGGVQGDLMSWEGLTTRARLFSRSKTTEVTEMFDGKLRLEVGYQPAGRRGTEDLSVRLDPAAANVVTTPIEVGIPQRETRASADALDPVHLGWPDDFDPARRTQPRLHLSHVMLDVHAKGEPRLRVAPGEDAAGTVEMQVLNTPPGRPQQRQVMAGVVDLLAGNADVREALGSNRRLLSDRLVAEFGYQRLQQDFKGMTNGEAVVLRVPGSDVRIEVKAANRELNVLALTNETEFNTGAGDMVTRLRRKVVSGLRQIQGGGRIGPDELNVSASYGGRKGSDSIHISGRTLETAVTTKTKEPGAILDGDGYLEVVVHKGDRQVGDPVEIPVGFRTVMPRSDLVAPPQHDEAVAEAAVARLVGKRLPESTVVRDIGSVEKLRTDLETAGKEYYGNLWPTVRDEVMQLVTQPALASRLGAMTRGERFELNSFDQSKPGVLKDTVLGRNLKVTVTATLTDPKYLRQSAAADLSRQNETSTFESERRQEGKHEVKQGGVGFPGVTGAPYANADLGSQERVRVGTRDSAADKLYANSKVRDAQDVFGGRVTLTLTLEGRGAPRPVEGDFSTEFSVRGPKAELPLEPHLRTHTVLPRNQLGASSVVSFKDLPDGRSGGTQVLTDVRAALEKRFAARGGVSRQLERTLTEELGPRALQANLSQLTRGGALKVPVGGPGWSAEVVVRARLTEAPVLRREVGDAEIEVGTQNRTGHGVSYDQRERITGTVGATGKPSADGKSVLTVDYSYRHDSATGVALETAGTTVNRAKNVSRAAVSDADVRFDVEIRGWTGGLIPSTTKLRDIRAAAEVITPQYSPVEAPRAVPDRIWQTHRLGSSDVVTNVFVPDARNNGAAPSHGSTGSVSSDRNAGAGHANENSAGGNSLGMDSLATNNTSTNTIVANSADTNSTTTDTGVRRPDFAKDLLRGQGDPGEFGGRDITKWLSGPGRSGLRHKLYDVLTPNTLHDQLRTMMSGRELVVSDGGVTIRIGASVRTLEHTGSTKTTEFNTGTQNEHSHSAADGATGGGAGSGHQLRATLGVSGGPWYAGGSLTGATGHDTQETWSNRAGSGNTTKVKPANASIFSGEADLHFRVEWKEPVSTTPPFVMATKHAYFRRALGIETVIDVAETRERAPVGDTPNPRNVFDAATAPRGAALRGLTDHTSAGQAVRIPPDRVWTHGLVDTDVVRKVEMGPDARQQLKAGAEEFLGAGTWDRIRGTVDRMIDPVALASRLSSPVTPIPPRTPAENAGAAPDPSVPTITHGPGNSTLLIGPTDLAGDARVEVRVRIKQLEFVRTDATSESNPTNTTSVTDGANAQRSVQAAVRLTGGGKGEINEHVGGRAGVYVDGAYQHRTDLATGEGGQIVNNAKIKTDTARYHGFAEVEVVYHKDGKTLPRQELMAIEIDIPVDQVKGSADVPAGGYLRFDEDARDGELRLHGASSGAVQSVARALRLDPAAPDDRSRILGVGRVARDLLADSLTTEGDRAVRWLRGLDRTLVLAADESNGGAFEQIRRVRDGQAVPAADRRRLQHLVEHVGEHGDLSAAEVNTHWNASGGPRRDADLSLREPSPEPDPTIRLAADAGSGGSLNRLLENVRRTVLAPEGTAPRRVEITLDAPAERAVREADRLERTLRGVLRSSRREVEVVIVTTTARVERAEAPEAGRPVGGVRSFRVGPPEQVPPVQTPPVQGPPVQVPPVQGPPVQGPPVQVPPVQTPPVQVPPVQVPPVQTPPVQTPPVQTPPVQVPPVRRAPTEGLPHTPVDEPLTSDSSAPSPSRNGSDHDTPDLVQDTGRRTLLPEDVSGDHRREATGASYATAPEEFYLHEGARLGDESDNVSVDTDLLDLPEAPHQRESTTNTWYSALPFDGGDSDNTSLHSDLTDESDSRSGTSEDSWVVLPPPSVRPPQGSNGQAPQGSNGQAPNTRAPNVPPPHLSNTPLPSHEADGPPQVEEPAPAQTLEDSIFSALTQWFPGGGERS
ncbi:EndoU domain-containing protein [Kitasatospora sp. NPDC089913]|uniref:EndoU domain-containing protein n=1 Tax=Kitasatospora sp. NPDC089913 TaxID=3364080 RepID=UPI003811F6F1